MGKIILEFDSEEEAENAKTALDGWKWKHSMWELDQFLRNEVKYNEKNPPDTDKAYETVRDKIREILSDNEIQLE